MPKVTVIIPVLNAASYIRKCMDSILRQTMQELEVLVVDAGSTDGTGEILKEYSGVDQRITICKSQQRSYGFQVNMALGQAKGEYIGIVESDDYISGNMYDILYQEAVRTGADYVKGDHAEFICLPDGAEWEIPCRTFPIRDLSLYDTVVCPADYPGLLLADRFLWRGIYKRSFLKDNSIWLHETSGAAFQDAGFLFQTIFLASKALYLRDIFYHYRRDNAGSSIYNSNGFCYLLNEYQYIWKNFFVTGKISLQHRAFFYCRLFHQIRGRFVNMATSSLRESETAPESGPMKVTETAQWAQAEEALLRLRQLMRQEFEHGDMNEDIFNRQDWFECRMFMEDVVQYAGYMRLMWKVKRETLSRIVRRAQNYPVVVIRGAGRLGEFVHILLERNGLQNIRYFSDQKESLWTQEVLGKKVIPNVPLSGCGDVFYIVAVDSHWYELERELRTNGVRGEDIGIYELGIDFMLWM